MNTIDRSRLVTMVWFTHFVEMVTSPVVQIVCKHHSAYSWDIGDALGSILFAFGTIIAQILLFINNLTSITINKDTHVAIPPQSLITQHGQAKINGKEKFVHGSCCTEGGARDAGDTALTIDSNSDGFGELEAIDGKLKGFDNNAALFGSPSYVLCLFCL